MIKNKKGFTLVELLSVIVLIGLLIGIGVPGVMKISERMKERSYKTKVNLIEQAGILWGQDNKTLLQSNTCKIDGNDIKCRQIDIDALIEDDYLDKNNDINGCVFIYRKNQRVHAKYDTTGANCSYAGDINGGTGGH